MSAEQELKSLCPTRSAPNGALETLLARAVLGSAPADRIYCLSLAAPLVPAERLLTLPGYQEQLLWAPSPEEEHSGVGAACVLVGSGAGRFAQIRAAAALIASAPAAPVPVTSVPIASAGPLTGAPAAARARRWR